MSTKRATGFTDLPWNLKLKIMDSVDVVSKLAVRQSSRELRELADQSVNVYEKLKVMFTRDKVIVQLQFERYQSVHIEFGTLLSLGYFMKNRNGSWCEIKFGPQHDMMAAVVRRVLKIFKTPRVSVKSFVIGVFCERFPHPWPDFHPEELEAVKEKLLGKLYRATRRMFYKLSVGTVEVAFPARPSEIRTVLELFDHEVVNWISIRNYWPTTHPMHLSLGKILETMHWRRAEKLTIQGYDHNIKLRQLWKFSVLSVEKKTISRHDLIAMIEHYLTRRYWRRTHLLIHEMNRDKILKALSKHPNAVVRPDQPIVFEKKNGNTVLKVDVTTDNKIRLYNVKCENFIDTKFVSRKDF